MASVYYSLFVDLFEVEKQTILRPIKSSHALFEKCPYSEIFWSEGEKIQIKQSPTTDTFQAVMIDVEPATNSKWEFHFFKYILNKSSLTPKLANNEAKALQVAKRLKA